MNRECAAFETQISSSLDGQSTSAEAEACRRHLEACEHCRALSERMGVAREVLRAIPPPEAPQGLLACIRADSEQELRRHDRVAAFWSRWRAPVVAAVAAAAVLLVVAAPWQVERPDQAVPGIPMTEHPRVIAVDPELPAEPAIVEAEDEAVTASEAEVTSVSPARARRMEVALTSESGPADDGGGVAESAEEPVLQPDEVPVPVEPELAFAPPRATVEAEPAIGPVLTQPRATLITEAPRMTMDSEPPPAPSGPSSLEVELASSVVARMLVDKFIADHMVETPATLLAVVTDTPTSELGRVVTEETENGNFGLYFTDAMRRALSDEENQLP